MASAAVNSNGSALQWVSDDLKDDDDIVMAAAQQQGTALKWASEAMRNTKEIVMQAVKQNGASLEWASGTLKHDCDVVVEAVRQNGEFLRWSGRALQGDKDVVVAAVKQSPHALEWASEKLRDDENLVLGAVRRQGSVLRWASARLKKNEQVVLAAVEQNPASLQLSPLCENVDVVSKAVQTNGACLNYASQAIKNNPELKKKAAEAENSAEFVERAIKNSKNDKEVLDILSLNGAALQWAKNFQDDKDRVLEAVAKDGLALEWADEELQVDVDILKAAVNQKGLALRFARRIDSSDESKQLVEAAIEQNGLALRHATGLFAGDRGLVLKAVAKAGLALRWADDRLKNEEDVVIAAVTQEPSALLHASSKLRKNRNFLLRAIREARVNNAENKVLYYVPAIFKDDAKFQLEASLSSSLAQAKAAKEVHVISTPFNPRHDPEIEDGDKTFQPTANLKEDLEEKSPGCFCLNPNKDLKAIAQQQGLTPKQQGQLWLKFFTQFLLVAQEKDRSKEQDEKGVVHFVCRKRNAEGCPVLDGNAQQGEWLIAQGFGFSDIQQHEYTELENIKGDKQSRQYLPQEIEGKTVLLHTGGGKYRTINDNLKENEEDGVPLYSSPNLENVTEHKLKWGWTVKCQDLGTGWVEVMGSPEDPDKCGNGKEVQEQDKTEEVKKEEVQVQDKTEEVKKEEVQVEQEKKDEGGETGEKKEEKAGEEEEAGGEDGHS